MAVWQRAAGNAAELSAKHWWQPALAAPFLSGVVFTTASYQAKTLLGSEVVGTTQVVLIISIGLSLMATLAGLGTAVSWARGSATTSRWYLAFCLLLLPVLRTQGITYLVLPLGFYITQRVGSVSAGVNLLALLALAIWPQFREHDRWRRAARSRGATEARRGVVADGGS